MQIEHKGKTYRAQIDPATTPKRASRLAADAARREILALGGQVSPAVLGASIAAHAERVTGGAFAFGGEQFMAWLGTTDGATAFLALVLGVPEADAVTLVVERGAEVVAILKQAVHAVLPPEVAARLDGQPGDAEATTTNAA